MAVQAAGAPSAAAAMVVQAVGEHPAKAMDLVSGELAVVGNGLAMTAVAALSLYALWRLVLWLFEDERHGHLRRRMNSRGGTRKTQPLGRLATSSLGR